MSGMFQRIARRHAGHSDEAVTSDSADEPVESPSASAVDERHPATEAVQAPASDEAPTERIEAIPAAGEPAQPDVEQPTVLQPAVPPAHPRAPAASVPPPTIDLRSRIPATTPTPVAAQAPEPAPSAVAPEAAPRRPGFRARGRMRRRLRYLRKLRELQVRDLGGLVFDLRRFERRRDDLVAQKLDQIRACDDELRALEQALGERRDLRDVREPGIGGTCPRCFAIFGSADRFCANCGAALGGAVQGPARPAQVPPAPPSSGDSGPQP